MDWTEGTVTQTEDQFVTWSVESGQVVIRTARKPLVHCTRIDLEADSEVYLDRGQAINMMCGLARLLGMEVK